MDELVEEIQKKGKLVETIVTEDLCLERGMGIEWTPSALKWQGVWRAQYNLEEAKLAGHNISSYVVKLKRAIKALGKADKQLIRIVRRNAQKEVIYDLFNPTSVCVGNP